MLKKTYQAAMAAYYVIDAVARIRSDSFKEGVTPQDVYEHAFTFSKRVLDMLRVHVEVDGIDDLVRGPGIICQNHTSLLDIPALLMFPGRKYFGTKKELFHIPIFGQGMHAVGMPIIDRSNPRQAYSSLEDAVRRMGEDPDPESYYLVMFPEGTRSSSRDYSMSDFRMGAFNLAARAGLAIIPVASYGAAGILPKKSLDVTPGTIHLRILPALHPQDDSKDTAVKLCRETRQAIGEAIWDMMRR
ncbi:1-acyl-sn-glycerol-3-phosphate acyltransferase [Candidatus Woesearchaeota archaeon]|nr:1-acyl-sn-glycerol-3-phosphate acyltransferase [Candidatus Woesearchaeota archaeon]